MYPVQPMQQSAYQQVRPMMQPGVGGAREMMVHPASYMVPQVPHFFEREPSNLEEQAHISADVKLRRLEKLSLYIAGWVAISSIVQYFIEIVVMDEVMTLWWQALRMHGPDVLMIAIGELPSFGVALMMALLMPLCGYLGAQRGHAPLVGAFGACSFLSCCCGGLLIVVIFITVVGAHAVAPHAEAWMVQCDPIICMPQMTHTAPNHVVDCLAAGLWQDAYKRRFPSEPKYHVDCPATVWLQCHHGENETGVRSDERRLKWRPTKDETETEIACFTMALHNLHKPTNPADDAEFKFMHHNLMREMKHLKYRLYGDSAHEEPNQKKPTKEACLAIEMAKVKGRMKQLAHTHSSFRSHFPMLNPPKHAHKHMRLDEMETPPKDVLGSCHAPHDAMVKFHAATEVVPEMMPKIIILLLLKAALTIPTVALGLVGMIWGKDAFDITWRARSYRAPMPMFGAMPQGDDNMNQPLMVNPAMGPPA